MSVADASRRSGSVQLLYPRCEQIKHAVAHRAGQFCVRINDTGRNVRLPRVAVKLPALNRAVELTSPVASEYGVSFLVAETAQTAMVLVDFERWVQVLVNLLSNAVKYSPAGDTVDIDIERRGRLVRVTVTDRGPGIPEEFRARVFEKFAQASTGNMRLSGTGLGLSIVKLLVEQHGGHVGFDSIRGRGTTFYVDMPLMETR